MRGHVRKRGKKSWAVVVDVGYDENGKRLQKWHSGFARQKDAERALTEILGRLEERHHVEPAKLTVRGFLEDEWLPAIRASLRPLTFESYRFNVARVVESIGSVRLQQLTPAMLNRLYGELGRERGATARIGHRSRHAASATCTRSCATRFADAVQLAPARAQRRRRCRAAECESGAAATDADVVGRPSYARFLEHVSKDRLSAAYRLAAMTGMRRGELLGLRGATSTSTPAG